FGARLGARLVARAGRAVCGVAVQVDHLSGDRHLVARRRRVALRRERQRAERQDGGGGEDALHHRSSSCMRYRESCENRGSVPQNQADVTFKAGEVYVAGPWFATEFRCTYRRRRSGEWVDARGAIFCETKDGKISEMRMYWHRSP